MTPRHPFAMGVCARAAALYGVPIEAMFSRARNSETETEARMVVRYVLRERYGWSYPEIGRAVGCDDAMALRACRIIKSRLDRPRIANAVRLLLLMEEGTTP